jgi:hypothetical protein
VAAFPGPKPASTKPNPDYKYQAFKAQQAAAAATFPSSAQRPGGRPQQPTRPTITDKEEFFGADTQGFFANRETSQPDFNQRRTAPSSAAVEFGSGNNNGFGSFYADADFGPTESAPVVAHQAARGGQAASLEEILAKKTQANPERPGFTPPKLIERFSSPVVEPSIAYNPPPPAPVQVFNPKLFPNWT